MAFYINIASTDLPSWKPTRQYQTVAARDFYDHVIPKSKQLIQQLHTLFGSKEHVIIPIQKEYNFINENGSRKKISLRLDESIGSLSNGIMLLHNETGSIFRIKHEAASPPPQASSMPFLHMDVGMQTRHGYGLWDKPCEKLLECYNPGYGFPKWTMKDFNVYKNLPKSEIYVDKHDVNFRSEEIKTVVSKRVPVNIGMSLNGTNLDMLLKNFNRTGKSGYEELYEKSVQQSGNLCKLPPNIAIYTYASVKLKNEDDENSHYYVHIINSVGIALDVKSQVDYKYVYSALPSTIRTPELIRIYESIFNKIFVCAIKHNLTTVVMSLVGANNFATEYKSDIEAGQTGPVFFRKEIWCPAFNNVFQNFHTNIQVLFMGAGDFLQGESDKLTRYKDNVYTDLGIFNAAILKVDLSNTLFVNAWDPHSVIGNGNNKDPSLDGYIGRVSSVAVMGTPATNEHLNGMKNVIGV
jgi:hypothetical protein